MVGWYMLALAGIVLIVLAFHKYYLVNIPEFKFGIRQRLFSLKSLPPGEVIAFNGEVGFNPDILGSGYHWFVPFFEKILVCDQIEVPATEVAFVISQVGPTFSNIPTTKQVVAYKEEFGDLRDVRKYLDAGGSQGMISKVLPGGMRYIMHPAAFIVYMKDKPPIGFRVQSSSLSEMMRTSQEILGVQDGAFKAEQREETIALKNFVSQGSDQHDISVDMNLQFTLLTTAEIPFNMARVGGLPKLREILGGIAEDQLMKILVERSSIEWPRYRDELKRLFLEGVRDRFASYNATIIECIINGIRIAEPLRAVQQAAAVAGSKVSYYSAEAEMHTARGHANYLKGMADEMEKLGMTEVRLQSYGIDLQKLIKFGQVTDMKSAHLKAIVEMLTENKVNISPSFQFDGRSIFGRILERVDGNETPANSPELQGLLTAFFAIIEKASNTQEGKEIIQKIKLWVNKFTS